VSQPCHATATGRLFDAQVGSLQLFRPNNVRSSLTSPCLCTSMSEDPLAIAKYDINSHLRFVLLITYREAKALHQGLKDLLKTRDPWNKEVEFQRKK